MSAFRTARRRARWLFPLLVAAIAPAGCGGSAPPGPASSTSTNPKAAQRQRDMEDFMKAQKQAP